MPPSPKLVLVENRFPSDRFATANAQALGKAFFNDLLVSYDLTAQARLTPAQIFLGDIVEALVRLPVQ